MEPECLVSAPNYYFLSHSSLHFFIGYAPIAQLDRVSPSEGEGRAFESHWVHHSFYILFYDIFQCF